MMRRSSILGHAVEVLDLVRSSRFPMDQVIREFFRGRHYLGARDRRAIADLVYGIVRNIFLLEALARAAFERSPDARRKPTMPSVVLLTAYVLHVLHEDPGALQTEIEGIWRLTAPDDNPETVFPALVGAELPPADSRTPAEELSLRHSLPAFLVTAWIDQFGFQEADALCAAMNAQAPTTVRVNTLKADMAGVEAAFRAAGVGVRRALLAPDGLHLDRRVDAASMHAYREGWFELQDEGSQVLSLLLDPQPGEGVIDVCAGAGGKSLHIAALMRNTGTIVAADIDRRRVRELEERARRAGVTIVSTRVTGGEVSDVEPADAVLIDAPCSGTGTLRRNPGLRLHLHEERVRELIATQRSILDRSTRLVRPGGRLLYATCSLLHAENAAQVESFLGRHPHFVPRALPGIAGAGSIAVADRPGQAMLLPHRHSTDGFFAALFERRAAD